MLKAIIAFLLKAAFRVKPGPTVPEIK